MNKTDAEQFELQKNAEVQFIQNVANAEGEQIQKIKKAEGEAESLKMLIDMTQVQGGIDVLKMRVAQEYITSMDSLTGKNNKLILP